QDLAEKTLLKKNFKEIIYKDVFIYNSPDPDSPNSQSTALRNFLKKYEEINTAEDRQFVFLMVKKFLGDYILENPQDDENLRLGLADMVNEALAIDRNMQKTPPWSELTKKLNDKPNLSTSSISLISRE
ncbi:MAG: hypothetical protein VXZ72_02620, partial [Chlamydiota bacterium]|nr:hypothetical protein [Chlamydiota bacterium]